jgi:DNA-directed RNA polymerase specialized sigma24 family protein
MLVTEAIQRLREAIHYLPSEEKDVFLLRQNGGLTYEQIAQRNNGSVQVIKEQMRSALRKLNMDGQEVSWGDHSQGEASCPSSATSS